MRIALAWLLGARDTAPGSTGGAIPAVAVPGAALDQPRHRRAGAAQRVEVRRSRPRSFVPAGEFAMGIRRAMTTCRPSSRTASLASASSATLISSRRRAGPPTLVPRALPRPARGDDLHGAHSENRPIPRRVYLDAYAIDRDEVSVADYRRCIAAGACTLDRADRRRRALHPRRLADGQRHLGRGADVLPLARRPAAHRGRVGARGARR